MLTYRGDKFVKGKKFKINESIYRFQKRDDKDNLIFESLDGKRLKLTEEEFNKDTNNYSEDEMIKIVKSYFEDNNPDDRFLASEFVKKYSMDDNYPKLQKYLKKILKDEARKRDEEIEK